MHTARIWILALFVIVAGCGGHVSDDVDAAGRVDRDASADARQRDDEPRSSDANPGAADSADFGDRGDARLDAADAKSDLRDNTDAGPTLDGGDAPGSADAQHDGGDAAGGGDALHDAIVSRDTS